MAKFTKKQINNIVVKIASKFRPDKIILFGSQARKNPKDNSDIDIMVVKRSSLRRDKRALEIDRAFANRQFPMDIVVYTPEEVRQYQNIEGSFIGDVLKHGKVVYKNA